MRWDGGGHRLVPRWVTAFFIAAAVVLIPWIFVLVYSSPQDFGVARHWKLIWGGFDGFLVLGFASTAWRILRRSPGGALTAAATGTMLLIDAWFDILTAHHPADQVEAVLMAVFAEIPCAIICFYVARRIVGLFTQAVPYLREQGFEVRGGKLVAPGDRAASTDGGSGAAPVEPGPDRPAAVRRSQAA